MENHRGLSSSLLNTPCYKKIIIIQRTMQTHRLRRQTRCCRGSGGMTGRPSRRGERPRRSFPIESLTEGWRALGERLKGSCFEQSKCQRHPEKQVPMNKTSRWWRTAKCVGDWDTRLVWPGLSDAAIPGEEKRHGRSRLRKGALLPGSCTRALFLKHDIFKQRSLPLKRDSGQRRIQDENRSSGSGESSCRPHILGQSSIRLSSWMVNLQGSLG